MRSRATYPYPRPRGRHPGGRREIDYRPAACNEACGSRNIHRPWLTAENESDDVSSGLSAHPTIRKVLSSKFKSAKKIIMGVVQLLCVYLVIDVMFKLNSAGVESYITDNGALCK